MAKERVEHCPMCSAEGIPVIGEVRDRFFGVPGTWGLCRCVNTACGTMWLDPRVPERDIGFAYANYYTHSGAPGRGGGTLGAAKTALKEWLKRGYIANRWRTRKTNSLTRFASKIGVAILAGGTEGVDAEVAFLGEAKGQQTLLDVGCGSGQALRRMKALGWSVEGLETDAAAAAEARKAGCIIHQASLAEACLQGDSFDAILMSHVIEHLYDPMRHLRECYRLLKPSGTLVVLTPNGVGWGRRHFGQDWRGLEVPRHIIIYNRTSLAQLLERSGFQIEIARCLTRGSHFTLTASHYARRARTRGETGVCRFGPAARFIGLFYQIAARIRAAFDADSPEEILVIARKPA